ncbi:hypothetical protein [Metasolibacillus sp.]|uniref:hypothetical protein n=1 Tax=Metasolibacillus sp. TaxID=2703680 RepID=UPI0025DC6C16|nr:hypothetical protein [Metasolibacillus sp.]MCT6923285.1 hypothetical protein [Metasolibacillus sp.]MCT6939410.1 hypothetical protein [Metasolibacillus sp.]
MKKKKTLLSVAVATFLLFGLSFSSGASAANDQGAGGGGYTPPPPKCQPGKACPILA